MSIGQIVESGLGIGLGVFLGTAGWEFVKWVRSWVDGRLKVRREVALRREVAVRYRADRQGRQVEASWVDPDKMVSSGRRQ